MIKAIVSIVLMLISGFAGMWFGGASFNAEIPGAIMGILIAGFACLIYCIDSNKFK